MHQPLGQPHVYHTLLSSMSEHPYVFMYPKRNLTFVVRKIPRQLNSPCGQGTTIKWLMKVSSPKERCPALWVPYGQSCFATVCDGGGRMLYYIHRPSM